MLGVKFKFKFNAFSKYQSCINEYITVIMYLYVE